MVKKFNANNEGLPFNEYAVSKIIESPQTSVERILFNQNLQSLLNIELPMAPGIIQLHCLKRLIIYSPDDSDKFQILTLISLLNL